MYNLWIPIDTRIDDINNQIIKDGLSPYAEDFDLKKYVNLAYVVLMDGDNFLHVVSAYAVGNEKETRLSDKVKDELVDEFLDDISEQIRDGL